jgi:phosphoribosylaminoimidazolecarboxamide formyltransferase/IMP cyclohydrolase
MKRRALISVYDKTGILDLAKRLAVADWELVSTGGTAAHLRENGLPVTDVSSLTNTPECLGGRVKTLHPAIHGGILARRDNPEDMASLEQMDAAPIDLVVVNLYPFFEKVQDRSLDDEAIVEFIDIGGPSMLRAAAKNYKWVSVFTEPVDYSCVSSTGYLSEGPLVRRHLAAKAFNLTSAYDAAVASYLFAEDPPFPLYWTRSYRLAQPLRYGENAHQSAALYVDADRPGFFGGLKVLQGKELSYNNMRDIDAAWGLVEAGNDVWENPQAFCVAVKHNQPCGAALGETCADAYQKAYDGDPVSIFGGIVACSVTVDEKAATLMAATFLEVIIAPSFTAGAIEIFAKKKNLRLVEVGENAAQKGGMELLSVNGGLLVQTGDDRLFEKWDVVTKVRPTAPQEADMRFGMVIARAVKSNAIVVVRDGQTLGICGGQTNRVWAAEQALKRASERAAPLTHCVLISDGFFPFRDCADVAAAYGIAAILQPGGSIRDQESVDA